jgi:protein-disulfide isomerase
MNKRFVIILAACIVLFGGLLVFGKKDNPKSPDQNGDTSASLSNHTTGQGTTGVKLTEYGDFQCPACYQYYPVVKSVKQKYGDQITFQFRHYPLTEIHPNALISAKAAEAAGLQGKFFEMHDLLYENQPSWSDSSNPTPIFEQFAQSLSLDMNKFKEDMKSPAVNDTVMADRSEARRLNYQSTPTFEINGSKIENPKDLEGFSKLIDEAIANSQNNNQNGQNDNGSNQQQTP